MATQGWGNENLYVHVSIWEGRDRRDRHGEMASLVEVSWYAVRDEIDRIVALTDDNPATMLVPPDYRCQERADRQARRRKMIRDLLRRVAMDRLLDEMVVAVDERILRGGQ